MSETDNNFAAIRDALDTTRDGDPTVTNADRALARIQAHVEALEGEAQRWREAVESCRNGTGCAFCTSYLSTRAALAGEPEAKCPNIPGHETHMPYCGFSMSPIYSGHTVPTGTAMFGNPAEFPSKGENDEEA